MRALTGARCSASASSRPSLGIAAGLLIDWFPVAASSEAKPIDTLWDVLIISSVPVFVGVTVVVLFSVLKFRMRPGEENLDGPPIHGNTRLEVIWTAIPAILLVGLCTYAFIVLEDVEAAESNPLQGARRRRAVRLDVLLRATTARRSPRRQLHVPINRQVKFTLQSKDVLHDFWVPAFRMKKDAVPGIDVTYTRHAEPASARTRSSAPSCAGSATPSMRSTAVVQTRREKFAKWLSDARQARRRPPAAAAAGGGGARPDGKAVFTSRGATAARCHTLADAGANGTIGPDLDTVLKGKDEAFIRQSIVDPSAEIADGYQDGIMPPNFEQTAAAGQARCAGEVPF